MFGLTVEKLFLVALIAAVLIGPHRMPRYAARFAAVLRQVKGMTMEARRRVEEESGAAIVREDWQVLDPRRYDPRRIIREAWQDEPAPAADPVATVAERGRSDPAEPVPPPQGRWIIAGSSAHPRRVWVAEESVPDSTLADAAS